jgi:DNA-binding transcriptional LysR family regulator
MELHQIKYFTALCETLNFTRAAERCNVTQPSLTRAIRLLEEELGGPLFHRERANTHLTELGRLMQPHLEQVLAEIEAAKGRAQAARKLEDVTLTLGMMCSIGPGRLIDLVGQYRGKYPSTTVVLHDEPAAALQERLINGDLDVALLGMPEGLDDRLHLTPLYQERFEITFAPGHRFEQASEIRCADLQGETYVCRAHCEYKAYAGRILGEMGISTVQTYISDRDDWCFAMIMAGMGLGFTPEYAAGPEAMLRRRLVDPEFARTVNVATVRGRPHSPAVGAFMREAVAWRNRNFPDRATSRAA